MSPTDVIGLEAFYAYGYQGREMMAVRAPFAMAAAADEIIGRRVMIGAAHYRVVAVKRQVRGPIAAGEPIGIEIRRDGADAAGSAQS